jgi:hypothetical protein
MPKRCLVCYSPNRKEIEEYYFKTGSVKKTLEYTVKNLDPNITYDSLRRHTALHLERIIEETKKAHKLRTEIIKKDIYQDIEISRTLTKNLQFLAKQIEDRKEHISTERDLNILMKLMSKVNETIELIMKFKQDLDISSLSKDINVEDKILYCIDDFPIEYKKLFLKRWNEYETR